MHEFRGNLSESDGDEDKRGGFTGLVEPDGVAAMDAGTPRLRDVGEDHGPGEPEPQPFQRCEPLPGPQSLKGAGPGPQSVC